MDYKTLKQNLKLLEIDVEIAHIKHQIAELQQTIWQKEIFLKSYEEEKEKVKSLGIDKYEEENETVNPLSAFLNSSIVTFGNNGKDKNGNEVYCREKVFVAAFNDYCRESKIQPVRWTSQFYSGPFADFNIKVVKNKTMRYPNKEGEESYGGIFLMGVDISERGI